MTRRARAATTVAIALLMFACSADDPPPRVVAGAGGGGEGGRALACVPPDALFEGACMPTGVPSCASGFAPDDRGGCVPILPSAPCAEGEVALPGETSCRPLVACGDTTWANIPIASGSEYVDPSYTGGDSDGTIDKPWTDIQIAIQAAEDGDIVALAAGDYGTPPPLLSKRLRIWGRCPELVRFTSETAGDTFFIDQSGFEVHQISIGGGETPLIVSNGTDVVIDRVWVHDVVDVGILITSFDERTRVTIVDSLVERAAALGIVVVSADADIARTVVRDMVGNELGPGRAIDVEIDPLLQIRPVVTMTDSLVLRGKESGFACLASTCTLLRSAIVDTEPQADGRFGIGFVVQYGYGPAAATVDQSYIGGAHMFGISAINADIIVRESTIDGVAPQQLGEDFGDGIAVLHTSDEIPATATLERSRVANAARAGIAIFSAAATFDRMALECNTIQLNGETVQGRPHEFTSLGANACFCGDQADPCKLSESQLKPPPAP